MQLIDGEILRGDASHKEALRVIIHEARKNSSDSASTAIRPINGLYTIGNQYEQIIFQRPMATSSLSELKDDIGLLLHRYQTHNFMPPKLFSTDECCDDRNLIGGIFEEYFPTEQAQESDTSEISAMPPLPLLTFPDEFSAKYIMANNTQVVMLACECLRDNAKLFPDKDFPVLGLDIEWNPSFMPHSSGVPATLQLSAHNGACFLFHLKPNKKSPSGNMPSALRTLLTISGIHFVGVHIKGDLKLLRDAYDVDIPNNKVHDIRVTATERKVKFDGGSLQAMTEQFLGKHLPKPALTRLSDWERQLTSDQIRYACLDAYASILCFDFVVRNGDPGCASDNLTALAFGTTALLYSMGKTQTVATGIIENLEAHASQTSIGTSTAAVERFLKSEPLCLYCSYIYRTLGFQP